MPKKVDQISDQWSCNACKKQLHLWKPQRKACKSGSQRLIFVTKPRSGMQSRALPERKLQVWLLKTTHHLEMQVQHKKTIRITHHNTRRCNYNRRRAGFFVMKYPEAWPCMNVNLLAGSKPTIQHSEAHSSAARQSSVPAHSICLKAT